MQRKIRADQSWRSHISISSLTKDQTSSIYIQMLIFHRHSQDQQRRQIVDAADQESCAAVAESLLQRYSCLAWTRAELWAMWQVDLKCPSRPNPSQSYRQSSKVQPQRRTACLGSCPGSLRRVLDLQCGVGLPCLGMGRSPVRHRFEFR